MIQHWFSELAYCRITGGPHPTLSPFLFFWVWKKKKPRILNKHLTPHQEIHQLKRKADVTPQGEGKISWRVISDVGWHTWKALWKPILTQRLTGPYFIFSLSCSLRSLEPQLIYLNSGRQYLENARGLRRQVPRRRERCCLNLRHVEIFMKSAHEFWNGDLENNWGASQL